MSDAEDVSKALRAATGEIKVDDIGGGDLRISLPDHHLPHGSLTLLLKRQPSGWMLSDYGHTAFRLGVDFNEVAGLMECAGAPVSVAGDELRLEVADGDLGVTIQRFAATITSAPLIQHALECARGPAKARPPQSSVIMAHNARQRIKERFGARFEPMLPVDKAVRGALDAVRAPLQLRVTSNARPRMLVACVDLTAKGQSVTAAKQNAAYLWLASHNLDAQRYTIAQGSPHQVEQLASVFDRESRVTVVAADDDEALLESVGEQLHDLELV